MRLIEDEGRHHLAAHPDRYDILQLSGVDSYSGTPGAAHVFSESYLYTAEAFDLYFSRLTEGGILNVMRLEFTPPREMLKALVTAVGTLRRAGIASPAEHIQMVTARSGNFTALLVKKTPFTADERRRLAGWANASPYFAVSAAPDLNARRDGFYQVFLDLDDAARERAFVAVYPFDVSPATDDRPFFFKYSSWGHLLPRDRAFATGVPVMEVSLLLLAAAIGATAFLCIHLPLRFLVARGVRLPTRGRYGLFFAAIGIGYFAIEIALLQRFGLFLGHPNYALSVVLAALLLTSGMGALASPRLPGGEAALRFTAYAVAGVVLAERTLALPLLPRLAGLGFGLRVLVVFLLVAPIGFLLGSFLPRGLERLKADAPALVPWAWGLNGIFSVLAPVFAIGFSVTWGIEALLLAAIPVYLVAGWALPPPSTSPAPPAVPA